MATLDGQDHHEQNGVACLLARPNGHIKVAEQAADRMDGGNSSFLTLLRVLSFLSARSDFSQWNTRPSGRLQMYKMLHDRSFEELKRRNGSGLSFHLQTLAPSRTTRCTAVDTQRTTISNFSRLYTSRKSCTYRAANKHPPNANTWTAPS